MSKEIREADLIEYPFEDEQQFGRNYLRRNFTWAGCEERLYFETWYNAFKTIAMSSIKWNDVPAGIDRRAIEFILLHFGSGGLFSEYGGLLFAQASYADMINMYYNPNKVLLTSPSGDYWYRHAEYWTDGETVHDPDCVVCWDNMERRPLLRTIRVYAKRIAKYDRIIDVNAEAQLTPWIIAGKPEQRKNQNKMQGKLEQRDQFWQLNETGLDTVPYVMQTGAPFVADKLQMLKQTLVNECLTMLGVDNTSVEKRERVQTAEVLSNNEMIMSCRESRLKARQQFCERAALYFPDAAGMSVEWGIEGSIADIAAAMTGGGFKSLMAAMGGMQEGQEA